MCVWAAGIAPRELTKKLMKDIPGQTNRSVTYCFRSDVIIYLCGFAISPFEKLAKF